MCNTGLIVFFLSCVSFSFCIDAAPRPRESFVDPNAPPFIPSHEWQEVKPGQMIPAGLHVRSNLQTGKTEAKLMEESDERSNLPAALPHTESDASAKPMQDKKAYRHEELAKALKNIAEHKEDLKFEKTIKDAVKDKKYRSYESLKKDFEAMQMQVKSDHEAIADLVRLLNTSTGLADSVQMNLLSDLEFYLHQIDNAQHFADTNGIGWMVAQLTSKTLSLPVKTQYLFALSAAVHSNIKVQIHAVDAGILAVLDHLVHATLENFTSTMTVNESHNQLVTLYSRTVGVLGGVLQQFPNAQLRWLQQGGLRGLGAAFDALQKLSANGELSKAMLRRIVNLQVKMLTLVGDLQEERLSAKKFEKSDRNGTERVKQYATTNYGRHLLTSNWCQRLQHTTLQLATDNFRSHDVREKILNVLYILSGVCSEDGSGWNSVELGRILVTLLQEYTELSKSESHDGGEYFTEMLVLVKRVRQQVHSIEDEL